LNHPRLFRAWQVLDFFNHIGRRHIETLAKAWAARKFSFAPAMILHQAQHFLGGLSQPRHSPRRSEMERGCVHSGPAAARSSVERHRKCSCIHPQSCCCD
jgi:hypothetical protein